MQNREQWIDVAKGALVPLVLLTHVIVSATDAALISADGFWSALHYPLQMSGVMAIYTYLAGVFVAPRTDNPRAFLQSIFSTLLVPYALWVVIFIMAQEVGEGVRNEAGTVASDASLLWTSVGWLWYLYVLAGFHVLALICRRHRWLLPTIGIAVVPIAAMEVSLLTKQACYLLIFYGLGVCRGRQKLPELPFALPIAAILSIAAWAYGLTYFHPATLPISLLWLIGAADVARQATGVAASVLAWMGQRCFAIYVSHFFFITATRIVLHKGLGITDFAVHLPLEFAAGLAGSLALLAASQRLGIAGLLGFGSLPPTWPSRNAPLSQA